MEPFCPLPQRGFDCMPLFESIPRIVTASQWKGPNENVMQGGVYVDCGIYYCRTAQGVKVPLTPGDWIILETDQTDQTCIRAYPCKDSVFRKSYREIKK